MMEGIHEDLKTLINNYKAGDCDTYWMTAVVVAGLFSLCVLSF